MRVKPLIIRLLLVGLAALTGCRPDWEAPEQIADALGHLANLDPKVTLRRNSEMVWQDAARDLPLFAFDAIRTYPQGKAKIVLDNGSVLDLHEDSLIILNPSMMEGGVKSDRAVVRNGRLQGKTTGELWILTSAALLRLKADSGGKAASATVTLKEGKAMEVKLESGQGAIVKSEGGKTLEKVTLTPGNAVTFPAPSAPEQFGMEMDESKWKERMAAALTARPAAAPTEQPRDVASVHPVAKEAPALKPLKVLISSPANYAEVTDKVVPIRGSVTRKGGEVRVNGTPVTIDDKLEFTAKVPLNAGANTIVIQLIREKGESVFHRWTVFRKN